MVRCSKVAGFSEVSARRMAPGQKLSRQRQWMVAVDFIPRMARTDRFCRVSDRGTPPGGTPAPAVNSSVADATPPAPP